MTRGIAAVVVVLGLLVGLYVLTLPETSETAVTPETATTPEIATTTADAEAESFGQAVTQVMDGLSLSAAGDYAQAAALFRQAADQGYARGQYFLGLRYANGQGVPQDDVQATAWYRKAADQGDVRAQYSLGVMYDTGRGVRQDYAEAVAWFRKAADQDNPGAQYNLGLTYGNGRGVLQDYTQAAEWHRKAADQGHVDAMYSLGLMYEDRQVEPLDARDDNGSYDVRATYVEAHKWFNLAASRAPADKQQVYADARDTVDSYPRMFSQDVTEAQQRAKTWLEEFEARHPHGRNADGSQTVSEMIASTRAAVDALGPVDVKE